MKGIKVIVEKAMQQVTTLSTKEVDAKRGTPGLLLVDCRW